MENADNYERKNGKTKTMDEDQKTAFNLAINGHNLLITGQGGTGKTFLVKKILNHLIKQNKKVAIVCSTGIAATQYTGFGAKTLHKWAGIEDGRYLNEDLIHLVKTDERFLTAKNNIKTTQTLIIDEVSMISAKVLNQVQILCKSVRDSPSLFGGLQVILVGSFYQLKPVENELYGDPGKHCFSLPWFETCFPHKINLNIIHRQDNQILIKTINELETGDLSDESTAFLKSLDRQTPTEESAIHLFARNLEVDMFNYEKLQNLEGEMKVYSSHDEGSPHYLNKFIAQKNLGLKINCPVMLIRNLSDTLVNGLRGVVKNLNTDSIEVKFVINEKPVFVTIVRETFTTFDPVEKIVVAKRVQFPLKTCYGITIHKSQGMTLPELVVDCNYCVQPGQLGVAVGRAMTVVGLKVLNFKKHFCKKHHSYVYNFYASFSIGILKNDLSCCKTFDETKSYVDDSTGSNVDDDDDDDYDENENLDKTFILHDDSDFSDSEIDKIDFIQKHFEFDEPMAEVLPSMSVLDTVFQKFQDTPIEEQVATFKDVVVKNIKFYDDWFTCQSSVMDDIGLNCFPEEEITYTQKHRNDYFVKFNKYITSDDYEKGAISLLQQYNQDVDGPAFQVLTSIMFHLEKCFFMELSSYLQLSEPEPLQKLPENIDADAIHEENPEDSEQPGPSGLNPPSQPVSTVPSMSIVPSVSSVPTVSTVSTVSTSTVSTVSTASVQRKRKQNQTLSKGKGKGKGRAKRKTTYDESDENCAVCNKSYNEGEEWICCDLCSLWYHRHCVHLDDDSEWCRLAEGEPFVCVMCQ